MDNEGPIDTLYTYTTSLGVQCWYIEGVFGKKWHRTDGPALIWPKELMKDSIQWYLNDVNYDFDSYCCKLNLSNEEKLILKLKYGNR